MSSTSHSTSSQWPRFLLFPALAVFGYAGLVSLIHLQAWYITAGWIAVLSFAWFCLAGSFHEAAHGTLFNKPILNEIFGQVVGFLILIPFSTFRATHRTHHAYMNTPKDYELWPYSSPNKSLSFRRLFVVLDFFFGIFTAPLIYGRISRSKTITLTAREKKFIPIEYTALAVGWTLIIGGIAASIHYGYYQPKPAHLLFLLPLVFSPMINTVRKFTEHVGMESIDPVQGTRTVAGKNWVTNLASYFLFDISVHGPHHRYPKVPGPELKNKLKEMQEKNPERDIPVFRSYWHVLMHTLPCLWKNPGVGMAEWPQFKGTQRGSKSAEPSLAGVE